MSFSTIQLPKAPALPNATPEYQMAFQDQFENILRLYFNRLDAGVAAILTELIAGDRYGSFSDTTDQPIVSVNTPQTMTFDTTDVSHGVTIGSPTSRIITAVAGVYNFQFSAQIESSTSASRLFSIWPRINGVDVPNSAGDLTIKSNSDVLVPAWNYVLPMSAGDYFELVWACDGNNVMLSAHPVQTSPFNKPAIPSIILTATQVNQ